MHTSPNLGISVPDTDNDPFDELVYGTALDAIDRATFAVADLKLTAIALAAAGQEEAETGWLTCNGAAVLRATFAALFAKIGVIYGAGDGSTTFNLPNLVGKVPVPKAAAGAFATRGASGGEETHALTTAELAAHAHGIVDPTHRHSQGITSILAGGGASQQIVDPTQGPTGHVNNDLASTGISINNAGGGGAHNNVQPFQVLGGYLIKY